MPRNPHITVYLPQSTRIVLAAAADARNESISRFVLRLTLAHYRQLEAAGELIPKKKRHEFDLRTAEAYEEADS